MVKKGEPSYKQLALIFLVAIITVLALISAANNTVNIAGTAVSEPVTCDQEEYCVQWNWVENVKAECAEYNFNEYKECESYSWPLDAEGKPKMQCDSWNFYYKNECIKWSSETVWNNECVDWRTKHECKDAV